MTLTKYPEFDSDLERANLGYCVYQHLIGLCYLENGTSSEDLVQSFKWLLLSVTLGNNPAMHEMLRSKNKMNADQLNEAKQLAMDWLQEKFESGPPQDRDIWSPELFQLWSKKHHKGLA